jgi:hypothetical protein
MAAIRDDLTQVIELIGEAHILLERFIEREHYSPDIAWESVVELQELTERLRQLRPPRVFYPRTI